MERHIWMCDILANYSLNMKFFCPLNRSWKSNISSAVPLFVIDQPTPRKSFLIAK
jgi:hypothetical protein